MKILYLLFAVFFLVLQSMPEFSEAQDLDYICRGEGGMCLRKCPDYSPAIRLCNGRRWCCRRRYWRTV